MSSYHTERTLEMIRHLASEFISRELSCPALTTVIRIETKDEFKTATVFITVFPEDLEKETIEYLNKQAWDLRDYFKKHAKMRELPRFSFAIDKGEKIREIIDRGL